MANGNNTAYKPAYKNERNQLRREAIQKETTEVQMSDITLMNYIHI